MNTKLKDIYSNKIPNGILRQSNWMSASNIQAPLCPLTTKGNPLPNIHTTTEQVLMAAIKAPQSSSMRVYLCNAVERAIQRPAVSDIGRHGVCLSMSHFLLLKQNMWTEHLAVLTFILPCKHNNSALTSVFCLHLWSEWVYWQPANNDMEDHCDGPICWLFCLDLVWFWR